VSRALLRGAVALLALAAAALPAAGEEADALAAFRKAFAGGTPAPERARAARGLAGCDSKAAAELVCSGFVSVREAIDGMAARRTAIREEMRALYGDRESLGEEDRALPDAAARTRLAELNLEEESLRERDAAEREVETVLLRTLSRFREGKAVAFLCSTAGRSSSSPALRAAVLGALGSIGGEGPLKAVRSALRDRDPSVREAALGALARLRAGEEEALAVLAAGLADERWTVRLAAARRLAEIGSPEAVDLLVPRLAEETGKPRADLASLLRGLTGQRFGPEPEGWAHWWKENREAYVSGERTLTPGAPGPPRRGDGPGGEANYYGITVESKRILFVLDVSGSMDRPGDGEGGESKFEAARREFLRCVRSLDGESWFTLFVFHDTVSKWRPRLVRADAAAREEVAKWVEGLGVASWTNTYAALEEALNASAANPRNNMGKDYAQAADTIFLLTDGAPTTPGGKLRDAQGNPEYLRVLEAVRAWNGDRRVAIHAIGVGLEINADFLSTLARENGGTFVQVK